MVADKIKKIQKRDGRVVDFDQQKITDAIEKAVTASGQGDGEESKRVSDKVVELLNRRFRDNGVPQVEQIQDIVEETLIAENLAETAKAYILYREQRRRIREAAGGIDESLEMIDKYIKELDWQVYENANMAYSLQGLNHYGVSALTKRYWLNKVYPKEIREAAEGGDFHIHNLDTLATYCNGWDLYDLLLRGFGGVQGKVESKPAKHLASALGQLVNFWYIVQGESAGAQAISSFDTLLAPFVRYDNLNYHQVKQAMQEFLFNCSISTRVGFQNPFTNLTIDIKPSPALAKQPVIIGGKAQKETYGEFQEEMNMINRAFYEGLMEGDAKGRPFTFPIPTVNITKDFDWDDPNLDPLWEATAKYGVNYFSNFINSDMKPEDVRSMCCRLRLSNKELYKRGGGLFGSQPLTGSIGVVTINMPRIGYLSKTKKEFFERLGHMMDLAKESLEIKRKSLDNFMEKGLYPYSKHYLSGIKQMRGNYYGNHFSTIGLVGMNETMLNFIGENIGSKQGKKLALEIMDFMRERLIKYQEETNNPYNLEATPAESTAYRLAQKDKEKYPDIITAGEQAPYYTNSIHLPVNYTDDLFEVLKLQDELQTKFTGGTVIHLFLGERIFDIQTVKSLIKKIFENFRLPYITLTPTFSICPSHGYLNGEHFECPKCTIKQPCEVYSRIVGYLRPVQQWNKGKKEEFRQREEFQVQEPPKALMVASTK
ncbi:MAG: ribonucleoside triphosphate reductase [Candidatus Nealsonbacteria bacterium RIFCSPLOWO2_01_FULL_43_32]|uniref:Ribonucleoside triphosphate reductase n=1 Tax=Candidatus Nealsonbacteria bacterium RIFCSPLOWO2_01_FULL_43_32 TaxID=1801672 RepID=A0A1G2EEN7_9BACT|nr:MAG: ribonucleoside triphosphate reductase [Candidatus Nealsonbacteria bacterium RIFCSPLOWO2_01_FULL_43_32]